MDIKTQRMCPNAGLLRKKKWLFDKATFTKIMFHKNWTNNDSNNIINYNSD